MSMNTLIQEGFVKEEIESEINVNKLSRIPNKMKRAKRKKKGGWALSKSAINLLGLLGV